MEWKEKVDFNGKEIGSKELIDNILVSICVVSKTI